MKFTNNKIISGMMIIILLTGFIIATENNSLVLDSPDKQDDSDFVDEKERYDEVENKELTGNQENISKQKNNSEKKMQNITEKDIFQNKTSNQENNSVITNNKSMLNLTNKTINKPENSTINNNSAVLNNSDDYDNFKAYSGNNNALNNKEDTYSKASGDSALDENYKDLDSLQDISEEKEATGEKEVITSPKKRDIKEVRYLDGEKILEYMTFKNETVIIDRNEKDINEFEKKVNVSSKIHFDDEVRIYSKLPQETEKENIKIYWENQEIEITEKNEFGVEYYDKDENGLIEKISWIIPHLSEQIFKIKINLEEDQESPEIMIKINNPLNNSIQRNPILFNISVNYTYINNLTCNLNLTNGTIQEDYVIEVHQDNTGEFELSNGKWNYKLFCIDTNNNLINKTIRGNFSINESFYVSETSKKVFLLDGNKNENVNFYIKSENGGAYIELIKPSVQKINYGYINSVISQQKTILKSELTEKGLYKINVTFDSMENNLSIIRNFSVAEAKININNENPDIEEEIEITINIDSQYDLIENFKLKLGDNSEPKVVIVNDNIVNQKIKHSYGKEDVYNLILEIEFESRGLETLSITKNGINVKNPGDTKKPVIEMIYPEEDEIIYTDKIKFKYRPYDNVKLKNCTFELYNATKSGNNWNSDVLLFPISNADKNLAKKINPANNTNIEIELVDFEQGKYIWEVECYDNSSNKGFNIGFFEIDLNQTASITGSSGSESRYDYEDREKVENLIKLANDFIEKESQFDSEERKVISDLKLMNDVEYYKKRLIQIDNYLGDTIRFTAEDQKEQRIKETKEEIDLFYKNIPIDLKIINSKEYVKNSFDTDIRDIVEEYMKSVNINLNSKGINALTKHNKEIQKFLQAKVSARVIEITYPDRTDDMTLITKEITIVENQKGKILEVIPKDIVENADEIEFLQEFNIIKQDPIIEFDRIDLEENKIVYYVNKKISLDKIEKIDTYLFEEKTVKEGISITGFAVFDVFSDSSPLYYILIIILIILLIYLVSFLFKKYSSKNNSKDPNIFRIVDLIEDSRRSVREGDIERARENYNKIKEIYRALPDSSRRKIYPDIRKMEVSIDRKDIFNLVKEYEQARKEWRKEDSINLYKDIQKIYKRLPEKDQEEVYKRVLRDFI